MKYQIIIDLSAEANPGTPNHIESILANRNNHIKVLEVIKLQ